MAQLTKIINFLTDIDNDIKEEVYNREDQANEKEYKWSGWADSEKGQEYIYKTEALDDLRGYIYEVIEQAEKIKNKEYY